VIRTVTLNPALDKKVVIEGFAVDQVNRVASSSLDAGGKGINVAKALATLGVRSTAYGIAAGKAGDFILDYLDRRGIEHRFAYSGGETRTNLKIVDPLGKTHTDINEAGPRIEPFCLSALEAALFAEASPEDIYVFSGSVPEGVDAGIYAKWIDRAHAAGARTVLDAEGELLRQGAAAMPSLMKPNLRELEGLVGTPLPDEAAMIAAIRALLSGGSGKVALSLGPAGALFVDAKRAIRARGIPVAAASTVGAGDSMLAAIVAAMQRNGGLEDMVAPAIAAATAAVAAGGSAAFTAEAVAAYEIKASYEILEYGKAGTA
jgi:1-phosphofructokinase